MRKWEKPKPEARVVKPKPARLRCDDAFKMRARLRRGSNACGWKLERPLDGCAA